MDKKEGIKWLELALTIVIFVLHYEAFPILKSIATMITTGTYVGYLIIMPGLLHATFTGAPVSADLNLYFMVVGGALYIISGILSFDYYNNVLGDSTYMNTGLVKSGLSVINGVTFVVDIAINSR